jgi:zinc transporter ZupT
MSRKISPDIARTGHFLRSVLYVLSNDISFSMKYASDSLQVEPISAVFGAAALTLIESMMPYALAFAAGAMITVVVDDLIPEAQKNGNGKLASIGAIFGFAVMMALEVGLA